MGRKWVPISSAEAEQHPLYGVRGWLLVFAIGIALAWALAMGGVRGAAYDAGLTFGQFIEVLHPNAADFLGFYFAVAGVQLLVVYSLMLAKARSFRLVTIALMLGGWPLVSLVAVSNPFPGAGAVVAEGYFRWVASCLVWCTYLHRSRRVRVTFEHHVCSEEFAASAEKPDASPVPAHVPLVQATQVQERAFKASMPPEAPRGDEDRLGHALAEADEGFIVTDLSKELEESFWSRALEEVEGDQRRPGLWARCFTQASGDEIQAKVAYLKARVDEMTEAHQSQIKQRESALRAQREQEQRERITREQAEREARLEAEGRAYELLPKGACPNCGFVQPLTYQECPSCSAIFQPDSAWALRPLPPQS